jgi:uncharacterized membrane protein
METLVGHMLGFVTTVVDFSTGAAIGVGVFSVFIRIAKTPWRRQVFKLDELIGDIRLTLGRWLALALELALAADVLRTVMVPTWDEIGKLAAIAALRTTLNYFLERELEQGKIRADSIFRTAVES